MDYARNCSKPVDFIDSVGWYPIVFAAFHNNVPAATLLLEKGADPRSKSPSGTPALQWARTHGDDPIVELIRGYL